MVLRVGGVAPEVGQVRHVTQEVLVSLLNHIGPLPASDHAQDCLIQHVQLQTGAEHFLLERAGINQQEVMSHVTSV